MRKKGTKNGWISENFINSLEFEKSLKNTELIWNLFYQRFILSRKTTTKTRISECLMDFFLTKSIVNIIQPNQVTISSWWLRSSCWNKKPFHFRQIHRCNFSLQSAYGTTGRVRVGTIRKTKVTKRMALCALLNCYLVWVWLVGELLHWPDTFCAG